MPREQETARWAGCPYWRHQSGCQIKVDSVVYAGVCVWDNVDMSCSGWTIYARQFWVPSHSIPPQVSRKNHPHHLYWLRATQSVAELINAKRQAEKRTPPSFYIFGVTWSGIEPWPTAPWADVLTTMLCGGGTKSQKWSSVNHTNKPSFSRHPGRKAVADIKSGRWGRDLRTAPSSGRIFSQDKYTGHGVAYIS